MKIEVLACDLCGVSVEPEDTVQLVLGEYVADDVCPKCADKLTKTAQGLSPEARAARSEKRAAASKGKKK